MSDEAPGWDAIDQALTPIVGTQEPTHWGTATMLPDQDGIWGISAYALDGHWLYVTYGLTELFGKVSDQPEVSGWGAEFTMRVGRATETTAPEWPTRLLARLGELVFERSTLFTPGTRLQISDSTDGPIPPAVCWANDPLLAPVNGPNGRFEFFTTIGISAETLETMRATTTADVLTAVAIDNPLLITGGPGATW